MVKKPQQPGVVPQASPSNVARDQSAVNKDEFICGNERPLLSLGFKCQEHLSHISTHIKEEFFLYEPHRIVYSALLSLMNQVKKIDLDTLSIRCSELGLNKKISDDYLPLICFTEVDDSSLDIHLNAVKNAYLKYRLGKTVSDSLKEIKNNKAASSKKQSEDLICSITREISKLNAYRGLEEDVISFADRAEDFLVERSKIRTDVLGYRTGLDTLDKEINGLMKGGVVVFAARKKTGKSAILVNIADYIAYETQQCSVLFLSTEMYSDEDLSRTLAIRTLINEREISNGTAWHDAAKRKLLKKAVKQMEASECQIHHQYIPNFGIKSLVSKIKYWNRKLDNLGLVVFDYIKLPPIKDSEYADTREYQELGNITSELKNSVAGEENLAVVTACQLNRSNDVADSDRISRFANTVIFLRTQTPEELKEHGDFRTYGTHMLDIKDTRSGGSGKIPLKFYKPCLKVIEALQFNQDEEDDDNSDQLVSPLEDIRKIDENCQIPINITKDQLSMSLSDLVGGTDSEDMKNILDGQLGLTRGKD